MCLFCDSNVSVQAKAQFYMRTHMADESKNEYASQLQTFNAEQWKHFNNAIPHIFKVNQMSSSAALSYAVNLGYMGKFGKEIRNSKCSIFVCCVSQNLQDMDERRTVKLGETYRSFAEAERRVIPIVSKCLEGMVSAAKAVDQRKVCDSYRIALVEFSQFILVL